MTGCLHRQKLAGGCITQTSSENCSLQRLSTFIRPVVEILTALLKSEGFLSFGPQCRCRPKTNDESRDRERCDKVSQLPRLRLCASLPRK